MEALYREAILDHYKHPRRKGHLDAPDIQYHDHNPFCGDELTIELKVEDGVVVDAAFDGRGCAISQATASMIMEEIVGLSVDELKTWDKQYILDMLGIEIGPVRLKCALLSLKVLKAGLWGLEEWPE
ncbi:MAG: SUF system NifU family Fe-S cluster assembly protein [Caldilineaceae bacterium]|nr:SUF system NifU family Fe-S cluster assembly protein [Caldilineaceae bacterium]MCB9148063.1 SUF system NifU family Fe-S cluster assembly protein [Caldilineaceae bacterium]MCB9158187.1 SUF system NifU family Fe-S cluster assembly protein [Caldilineaceae bacterium]